MGQVSMRDEFSLMDGAVFSEVPETACKAIDYYWNYFCEKFVGGKQSFWFTLVHLEKGSSSVGQMWFVRPGEDFVVADYDDSAVDSERYLEFVDSLEGDFLHAKQLVFSYDWVPLLFAEEF